MVANLLAGDLDYIGDGISSQNFAAASEAWEASGTRLVWASDALGAQFQWRDPTAPWVGDVRVRQAIVNLLDRPAMSDTLQGSGPAGLFGLPTEPHFRFGEQKWL